MSHVPSWGLAVPGQGIVPALPLLPVLSTEEPLDGECQGKLALGPLAVPRVWAHSSPSLPQFPSCSGSRASPFLFRGVPTASCPQCSAALPVPAQTGRVGISSPCPVAGCWHPGQSWGTTSIPECSPGSSGVLDVLAKPHTDSSLLEPQPALPKVQASRN